MTLWRFENVLLGGLAAGSLASLLMGVYHGDWLCVGALLPFVFIAVTLWALRDPAEPRSRSR